MPPDSVLNDAWAQLGVAVLLVGLLGWLLRRAYARIEHLEQTLTERDAKLLSTTDELRAEMLAQYTEQSDRLIEQATNLAPLFREALDLIRQAAVTFKVAEDRWTQGR